jgi:peptide deformylase
MVPDPRLRTKCADASKTGEELAALVALMHEVMVTCRSEGIDAAAIAAPQVGVLERIVLIETAAFSDVLINPVIVKTSGTQKRLEACLSFPQGVHYLVDRANIVKFRYTDPAGQQHTMKFHDYFATMIQHELDHLDGVLMDDNGMPS